MKKILKKILLILIVGIIAIQFIQPKKNAGEEIPANQISAIIPVPDDINKILHRSCYDCHSNTTNYPWYSKIQPMAWFLNNHIIEGKRELNFSTFATYPIYRRYKKFKEIIREVKEGDMPMPSYTLIHKDAVLSIEQKLDIESWAKRSMREMEIKFPADSLVRPKHS